MVIVFMLMTTKLAVAAIGVFSFGIATEIQSAVDSAPATPALIPQPVKLTTKPGSFNFTDKTVFVASADARAEADKLAATLRKVTALPLPIQDGPSQSGAIVFERVAVLESVTGREGYRLTVSPARITIQAATDAGLFYGGVTLRQLLPPQIFATVASARSGDVAWSVPCFEIEDYPRFVYRGLLLDVARHYMPMDFLKKFIDLAALHKFNTVQFHLTDDQGWRIEIKRYPRLTEIGSTRKESPKKGDRASGDGTPYGPFFYTQAELRELVRYAAARHVTIVPEIEMPGHMLAALTAYPQFSCTGGPFAVRTRWGIEADVLCPGNDQAIEFAQNILAEVLDIFPSKFIHIGGDESPRERWNTCPKCQARIRAEGLKNAAQLQTYLNRHIEKFLGSRGRRLLGWDEILEGGLTPGATVMSWRGVEGGIAAATAGHDVVMSPITHCYFDYAQAKGPDEPESIGGYIPLSTTYAFEPVPEKLSETAKRHILGAQGNIWTEYIWTPRDVEYFGFPRAVALAEVVWTPAALRDYAQFERRLQHHVKRLDQLDVNYRKGPAPRDEK